MSLSQIEIDAKVVRCDLMQIDGVIVNSFRYGEIDDIGG